MNGSVKLLAEQQGYEPMLLLCKRPRRSQCECDVGMNDEETHKIPDADHFTACFKSASSKIILGLFPPSSRETTLRFDLAEASKIFRPVSVLPVNAIFLICG